MHRAHARHGGLGEVLAVRADLQRRRAGAPSTACWAMGRCQSGQAQDTPAAPAQLSRGRATLRAATLRRTCLRTAAMARRAFFFDTALLTALLGFWAVFRLGADGHAALCLADVNGLVVDDAWWAQAN